MKLIKTLLVLLLTLIIIQVQPYIYIVATGGGGDDVDGSFESVGYNNPVELQGFELLDQNMNAVYALNPRDVYTVRLTLHDEDSIADIKQLSLVFYYGSAPTSDLSGLINTGTTTDGTAFVANWERDPISFDPFNAPAPAFNISSSATPSDYSWDIISSTTPAILANFDEELSTKTFTFELSFKVSKVAPQTSDGEWRFGVVVTDGLFPNESELDQLTSSALKIVSSGNPLTGQGTLFNMNWYGEVSIDQAMKINWTDVVPPLDFGGNNSLATTASITFISNGAYERATAASDIWDIVDGSGNPVLAADGSTMAALQAGPLNAAQTFGLVAAIEGDHTFNISKSESRLSPTLNSVTQYTILGGASRTTEAGNDYVFEYYLALSPFFQNAIYKGSIEIKINNSLSVAMIGEVPYNTLAEAASAANEGDSIKLLSNTEENVFLTTAASIDFNGFTLKGNLNVAFEGETTMTFSGLGILDGDLIIDAPDLTLDTDLTVLGETTINAIGSSSLNTSGVHKGGIIVEGPARINALNELVRPMVTINTTAAIVVDGFVDEVSINVDDVVITVNAAINRLITNNRPSTITLSEIASANIQNMVKNSSTNAVFDSIQAAIDAANDGDTIYVMPGIYEGGVEIINKNLTLIGPNYMETGYSQNRGPEAVISLKDFDSEGLYVQGPNNVIFKGFKIVNEGVLPHPEYGVNFVLVNNTTSIELTNNYITGITTQLEFGGPQSVLGGFGIWVTNTQRKTTALIEGNYIENLNDVGIYFANEFDAIIRNNFVRSQVGFHFQAREKSSKFTFEHNTLYSSYIGINIHEQNIGLEQGTVKDNNIFAISHESASYWAAVGYNDPEVTSHVPNLTFTGNSIDGSGSNINNGKVYGFDFSKYNSAQKEAVVSGNNVIFVDIGFKRGSSSILFDLSSILNNNTFPAFSRVIDNTITVPLVIN